MSLSTALIRTIATPTAKQAEAGNYQMAHVRIQGLDIAIETPRGRSRKPGHWPRMAAHYGYIKRTLGNDGDHVDVFVGPHPDSQLVTVIDQVDKSGKFDEHKCLIGFITQQAAVATYKKCFTPGWKVGPVTTMTMGQFKSWLKNGTQKQPVEDQVSRYAADWDESKRNRAVNGRFAEKTESQLRDRHDQSTHPNIAALSKDALAKSGDSSIQRCDFLKLSTDIVDRIKSETDIDVEQYHATIRGQQIRHIINQHGNESRAGQLDVKPHDIEQLPMIIAKADTIRRVKDSSENNAAIEFQKRINGHVMVVTMVSKNRKRLEVKSMRKYPAGIQKKETYSALTRTSETFKAMNLASDAGIGFQQSKAPQGLSKGASPTSIIDLVTHEVNKYSADASHRWITTENGSHVLIDGKGIVQSGMGGKFNGKPLGDHGAKSRAAPVKKEKQTSAMPPASPVAQAIRGWEADVAKLESEHAAKPDPKEHPLHHSKLADHIQRALLMWNGDAHETVQGVGQQAHGAGLTGSSGDTRAAKADAFESLGPGKVDSLMGQLESIIGDAMKGGSDIKPHIKHNRLIPRDLAARLPGDDSLFHPLEDHEKFAAMVEEVLSDHYATKGPKNSPGQMGFFGDGLGGSSPLRSSRKQQRMSWDETKHPRAKDGRFGDKPGEGTRGDGRSELANKNVKPGDQPGLIDGDGERKPAKKIGNDTTGKGKTPNMFGNQDVDPDQMDLFDGPVADDSNDSTPRDSAKKASGDSQDDYDFARASIVGNAGEDLRGSARHKRNAWRSLEEAESDGTAESLVTRENLLKNEPHQLGARVDKNPRTSLAMHLALKAFPSKPAYGSRTTNDPEKKKKNREQYVETYRELKEKAESLAAKSDDYQGAIKEVHGLIQTKIRSLRAGADGKRDPHNEIANALVGTQKKLGRRSKNSVSGQVEEVLSFVGPASDSGFIEKLKDTALEVIEGKSIAAATGTQKKKGERFDPSKAYVSHAERIGGPKLEAKTANDATAYMVDKIGLRGVQFGNSVSDKEREHHATMAAGALLDLADVTGLPLDAISLDGKLGLAIGARGRAGALAHYEPSSKVINLTRKNGVGSFAHEWGHAFDHEMGGGEIEMSSRKASPTFQSGFFRADTPLGKPMKTLRTAMHESGFTDRLLRELQDKKGMSSKKKGYWNSPEEKFARCFERFIQRKLESSDRKNSYLSGIEMKSYKSGGLWPTDKEVDAMTPAFDKLLDAYRINRLGVKDRATYSASDRHAFIMRYIAMTTDRYDARPAVNSKTKDMIRGDQGDMGHFVTIDGHPVFITGKGQVNRGPRHMKGKHAKNIAGDRSRRERSSSQPELPANRFSPKTKVDRVIINEVGNHPDDVSHFRELMKDAHQMLSTEANETNDDLRNLLSHFGHSGRKAGVFVAAVRRNHNKGGDHDKIHGFDEMAEIASRDYPRLLDSESGESVGSGDIEHALIERLKRGFDVPPTKTDDSVVDLARDMLNAKKSTNDIQYDPHFQMGSEWGEPTANEDDFVPFSVSSHDFIMEHYANSDKNKGSWITVHPNGPGTKGTPVLIDKSGEVIAGAGGALNGKQRCTRRGDPALTAGHSGEVGCGQ